MMRRAVAVVVWLGAVSLASGAAGAQGYTVVGPNAQPAQTVPGPAVVAGPAPAQPALPPPVPLPPAPLPPAPAPGAQVQPAQPGVPVGPGVAIVSVSGPARPVGAPAVMRRPEEYGGVVPGSGQRPPGARRARRVRGIVATWPGFQMVPGGSRVFVTTSAPVTVMPGSAAPLERRRAAAPRANEVSFYLPGARVLLGNNLRPLITESFPTPVARAWLRRRRAGVELVVALRAPATPTVTQETTAQGMHYVYVDFPAWSGVDVPRLIVPGAGNAVLPPSPGDASQHSVNAPPVVVPGPAVDMERPPVLQR